MLSRCLQCPAHIPCILLHFAVFPMVCQYLHFFAWRLFWEPWVCRSLLFQASSLHSLPPSRRAGICLEVNTHPDAHSSLQLLVDPGWVNSEAVFYTGFLTFLGDEALATHHEAVIIIHPLLAAFSTLFCFPASLPVFPALPKINHFYLNTHIKVYFWGPQTKTDLLDNTLN